MKNILIVIVLLLISKICFAASDTIIINKDSRLDVLTKKEIQMNKRAAMLTSRGQYRGFRIQVLSTPNRDQAFKTKADLLANFPEEKSYVLFQSPNFKVRIGNFLNRGDAEGLRTKLNKFLSGNVYVVEDVIEYTPPDEDANNE